MKSIFFLIIILILSNVASLPQRNRTPGGRIPEPENKKRIERIDNNKRNPDIQKPHRTIEHQQNLIQETNPPETEVLSKLNVDPHSYKPDRIEKNPSKYSFPDRIYLIPNIEFVLQKFLEQDYDGAIKLLNQAIEENHFVPDFYFLRGVAYMRKKSDFKKRDYYAAENDFFTVKTLEPNFPQLSHYIELLDFYLYGKPIIVPYTTKQSSPKKFIKKHNYD